MAKTALGYRAEVVGSLLRPEYLKEAFDRFDRDEIGEDELVATQDRAALEAIALQEACGVDVITDGEVRRKFWFDPLTASLSGYNPEVPAPVPFTRGTDEPSGPPPMLPAVTDTLGHATEPPAPGVLVPVAARAHPREDDDRRDDVRERAVGARATPTRCTRIATRTWRRRSG